ncbi:MAG: cobalt-precorrin-5B (C(1))-methyltransferase [Desulfamplus sp.]|nr:cobalt-precorrin-5B (C(1))-methyltransferase [Desulfamplus sp.]
MIREVVETALYSNSIPYPIDIATRAVLENPELNSSTFDNQLFDKQPDANVSEAEDINKLVVDVEIFVPKGKMLAEKTLNARLGIIGGISILGTTGIVKPMSHDAYIATIISSISVAQATGTDTLVFTTGRRSERFAVSLLPNLPEEAFIQTGDFFKASLESAVSSTNAPASKDAEHDSTTDLVKIQTVIIVVFFGKAVKMAMGFPHTHAAKSELTMKNLAQWAHDVTKNKILAEHIACSNTARHAFTYIYPEFPELIVPVGKKIVESAHKFSDNRLNIRAIILDFEGNKIFDSNNNYSATANHIIASHKDK